MILRGRDTCRRQKRWREKFKKLTVLLNFELLKQSFQSLIELLNIRMYEEEKGGIYVAWNRIWENVAQQNYNKKVGDVNARLGQKR